MSEIIVVFYVVYLFFYSKHFVRRLLSDILETFSQATRRTVCSSFEALRMPPSGPSIKQTRAKKGGTNSTLLLRATVARVKT